MFFLKKPLRWLQKRLRLVELWPFLLNQSCNTTEKLVLVTGADSTHFKSLMQFLASVRTYEPNTTTVVYDLGLEAIQLETLKAANPNIDLRRFDYSQYPAYFNIKVNAGEYAWKPVILSDTMDEFQCCVCWMDAGNMLTSRLTWLRRIVSALGIYSPHSTGSVTEWTHRGTFEYLNACGDFSRRPNLSGACVAVNYNIPQARELINQWKACSLNKECIAPAGSSRANHRQDQSVLSIIVHQSGLTARMPAGPYGFRVHCDID